MARVWDQFGVSSRALEGFLAFQSPTAILSAIEAPEFAPAHAIQLTVELPKADPEFLPAGAVGGSISSKLTEAMPCANHVFDGGRKGLSIC